MHCQLSKIKSQLTTILRHSNIYHPFLSLHQKCQIKISEYTYTHTFWPKHLASIFNSYQFLLYFFTTSLASFSLSVYFNQNNFPLLSFLAPSLQQNGLFLLCLLPTEKRDDLIYAGWCDTCHLREAAAAAAIPSYPKKLCRLLYLSWWIFGGIWCVVYRLSFCMSTDI